MKRSSRIVSSNSNQLLSARLTAYSATAGAALAAAPALPAAVVAITASNLTVNGASGVPPVFSLAVNAASTRWSFQAGPLSTTLKAGNRVAFHHANAYLSDQNTRGNFFVGAPYSFSSALLGKLAKGVNVAALSAGQFTHRKYPYFGVQNQTGHHKGTFIPAIGANNTLQGYLGFKVTGGVGGNYYGWLRVKMQNSAGGNLSQIALLATSKGDYGAYGKAGDLVFTGGAAVPEPSESILCGLGLLALGAAGVRELRHRRATALAK